MSKPEQYTSDSDQSDEDFCPDKEAFEPPSEEDSDGEPEEAIEEDTEQQTTKRTRKVVKKRTKKIKKSESVEYKGDGLDVSNENRRSTRQSGARNGEQTKGVNEKDVLDSYDKEKSHTDALWASFLSDVKMPKAENTATTSNSSTKIATATPTTNGEEPTHEMPNQIQITEVLDFAGEEVRVQKTVNADSIKENKAKSARVATEPGGIGLSAGLKRPTATGSGGLGSILNQIGKKKKISVLEKSKLDWSSFKQHEGIDEQLQTHNKGKDGYLERQDFLQRTDVRQFEIEKGLRKARRNP